MESIFRRSVPLVRLPAGSPHDLAAQDHAPHAPDASVHPMHPRWFTHIHPGILAYTEYGSWLTMKLIAWVCGAIVSVLIIASRKHYTVDIVIAW